MSVLFPDWLMENGSEAARKILEDPAEHERIFADMAAYHEGERKRTSLEYAVIASSRAYPDFAGKSLYEVARRFAYRDQHGEDSDWATVAVDRLPEVSMRDQYAAVIEIQLKGGASCVYHSMDEEDVVNIMQCPLVAVCSDSGVRRYGRGNPHPRGYGSNARVLGRYVREMKVLPLEEAVRKMTSLPALEFRFADRGLLREGYWADLTLFDPDTVIDKATFTNPHQYSDGIEYVIVNGKVVLARGELTGAKPGRPVMGPARVEIASP
jgi:N-acyl-D-aspartate/D-glutamate deacylase